MHKNRQGSLTHRSMRVVGRVVVLIEQLARERVHLADALHAIAVAGRERAENLAAGRTCRVGHAGKLLEHGGGGRDATVVDACQQASKECIARARSIQDLPWATSQTFAWAWER